MATTSKNRKAAPQDEADVQDYREQEILSLVDDLDQRTRVSAIAMGEEKRAHTGLLCMDLMLGGGIAPSMITLVGPEQSAKTTLAITMQAASVDQKIDLRVHWDAEGSTSNSTDYVANIFKTVGVKKASVETVFGIRGDKGWDVPPLVHLKDDYEGDKVFNWIHALQKNLPDKRYENKQWWYVYDDAKDVTKLKAKLDKLGVKIDKTMTSQNPGIWAPAEDGRLQALILMDSWPSVIAPSMDEEEGDNSIAVQARFFSKQIPRIKGALRPKRIGLVGINQLRINPMQRFGNPETEPGGQALKFFSDARLRLFPNALSSAPYNPKPDESTKGKLESEPSVNGGRDFYRYISVGTLKNKLSIPNRSTWMRLWVADDEGVARGYDPVFDLFHYLMQTGQASGKRSAIQLHLMGLDPAKRALNWLDFKKMVVGSKEQKVEVFNAAGLPPVDLRKGCLNQIRRGDGERLFVDFIKRTMAKGPAVSED